MSLDALILTVDIGTSNCKVTLFKSDGTVIAKERRPHESLSPDVLSVEQNPESWWSGIVEGVRSIGQQFAEQLRLVDAISVTGQMHGVVSVAQDGRAIGNCLTLRDRRSEEESKAILDALGEYEVYRITGGRLDASSPAAKIGWLKRHRPDVYRDSAAFLGVKDYIRMRMTGRAMTDPTEAAGTLLMDLHTRRWSTRVVQASGIDENKLPEILSCTEMSGSLAAGPARELGLREGTPVIVGGGDDIEFLGKGLVTPGTALEHIGTTGSIMACIDKPILDARMRVELYPHVDPSLWLVGGSTSSAGGALRWLREILGHDSCSEASILSNQGQFSRPLVFLPYLAGERSPLWEPRARAVIYGCTLSHSRSDILRAGLEGVACSLRSILDTIIDMGIAVDAVVSTSDDVDSQAWAQLRAGIYGRPLAQCRVEDATALGAMQLAAVGLGVYDTIGEAAAATVRQDSKLDPDESLSAFYNEIYRDYAGTSSHVLALARGVGTDGSVV